MLDITNYMFRDEIEDSRNTNLTQSGLDESGYCLPQTYPSRLLCKRHMV